MTTKWDRKRSYWYYRAIEQSNYPEKAFTAMLPLLRVCESVIDIGAGCGALSIPVAGKVRKVTAVEPSVWMYNLLLKRAKDARIKNIKAFNTGWKRTRLQGNLHRELKPHDMVICANLPHHIICNINFLEYIKKLSKKFIVYIQNAGGWNRFYYKELYPLLLKKRYSNECDYINTYSFLHKHQILANVKIFEYSLDQPFEDFDEALDFWRHRLGLKLTPEKERLLVHFLRKKLAPYSQRPYTLTAPFGLRRAAMMWWEV